MKRPLSARARRKDKGFRGWSIADDLLIARSPAVEVVEADALEAAFQAAARRVDRRTAKLDEALRLGDLAAAAELEGALKKTVGVLVPRRVLAVRKCWENGDSRPCGWPASGRYAVFVPDLLMERLQALSRAEAERRLEAQIQPAADAAGGNKGAAHEASCEKRGADADDKPLDEEDSTEDWS